MLENSKIGLALLLGLAWCTWVLFLWWKNRPTDSPTSAGQLVAYASQTGRAKSQAEAFCSSLANAALLPLNRLTRDKLVNANEIHFFVSTYGEGEPPDNGLNFVRLLDSVSANALKSLAFSVTAFGDSQYPAFCAFGKEIYAELTARGANALKPLISVDASQPQTQGQALLNGFADAVLTETRQLNVGSPHAGLYLLTLSAPNLIWQAGDLLDILPPAKNGDAEFAAPRSYSIASADSRFIENNHIQLIVRLLAKDDGSLGLASGYLTQTCQPGTQVKVKVRANPACQLKSEQAPLLLIGAGSGLAGLVGHIQQRSYFKHAGPIWLIYGERDPQFDCNMQTELKVWQQKGVLSRVDKAFSRSTLSKNFPKYVDEVLTNSADQVRQFIENGADIYVCGSFEGMGKSVDKALSHILGEQHKQKLIAEERYHKDLY